MSLWTRCCLAVFFMLLVSFTVTVASEAGTLRFYANGEELATEGFLSPKTTKDGWTLRFRHIYVGLAEITAYQTSPPYDTHKGGEIITQAKVGLTGTFLVDLVAEAEGGSPVLVGEAAAPAGHYNALSWKVVQADRGASAGYAMMFVGTAEKDGKTVDFELVSREETTYRCGEFVGNERKGFLSQGGTAEQEMTFHLDHIFGRADKAANDPMNLAAGGFSPFATGGRYSIQLKGMHIGHAGEGHCAVEWY